MPVNVNEKLVSLCEASSFPYFAQRLRDRDAVGRERYGTSLMTENGRDAFLDAEEELLDLSQYTYQMILEGNIEGTVKLLTMARCILTILELQKVQQCQK